MPRRAGVADGDVVRVTSAHGALDMVAGVTGDIRVGAVSLPHGYGDANVTALTSDRIDIDPHTGMVLQCGVDVTVTAARWVENVNDEPGSPRCRGPTCRR